MTTITDQQMHATWVHDLCTFSGSLMGKSDKVRHNVTLIANLNVLAVATVFIGFWTLISTFDSQRRGAYR